MKIITLFIATSPFFLNAQDIEVFENTTNIEFSGESFDTGSSSGNELILELKIKNNAGDEKQWGLQRILPATGHWEDQWMGWAVWTDPFGGGMYTIDQTPIWTTTSGSLITVPAGDSVHLNLSYTPISDGCDTYDYYILENGNRVDSFTVNICKTVGLDEINPNSAKIYPNPSSSKVNIEFQQEIPDQVYLFDLLGNKIATFEGAEIVVISTEQLSNGLYFASWEMDNRMMRQKFEVNH